MPCNCLSNKMLQLLQTLSFTRHNQATRQIPRISKLDSHRSLITSNRSNSSKIFTIRIIKMIASRHSPTICSNLSISSKFNRLNNSQCLLTRLARLPLRMLRHQLSRFSRSLLLISCTPMPPQSQLQHLTLARLHPPIFNNINLK